MGRQSKFERDFIYASKCELFLNNADTKTLQKALPVIDGGENSFIYKQAFKIERNVPAFPLASPMYGFTQQAQGCQPQIKNLVCTSWGQEFEGLMHAQHKFILLNVVGDNFSGNWDQTLRFARQIGPALGITDQWDDPQMKNTEPWREAKIEYNQFQLASWALQGAVFLILDDAGHTRNLIIKIYIDQDSFVLLPLTFAQHPNFPQPMVCHHAFSPDWWLFNTFYLSCFKYAEVIISNCWEICESTFGNEENIILGYFWGKEMIPHLHLECLIGRQVKLLIIESSDRATTRQNLLEAVLLQARLKSMDINAGILLAKTEKYFTNGLEALQKAKDITTEALVDMAKQFSIDIPDNLSPNRFGMLSQTAANTLVEEFAEEGALTAITVHDNVDMTLITTSVLAGILRQGSVFPDYWTCSSRIVPECFIISSTANRNNRILKQLASDENFKFRRIGSLKKEGVAKCLNGICHENNSDIFIFSGREIIKEYHKELQETCDWAIKKNKAIVIVTSHDGSASENFIADHAGRDIHIWQSGEGQYEYIIEDRPLLDGKSSFFKAIFSENTWDTISVSDEEIRNIPGRNSVIRNIGKSGGENSVKMENYRRS